MDFATGPVHPGLDHVAGGGAAEAVKQSRRGREVTGAISDLESAEMRRNRVPAAFSRIS